MFVASIILLVNQLITTFAASNVFYVDNVAVEEVEKWMSMPSSHKGYQTRCSRRFTPGKCMQPVVVVWTYGLQTQNCTERLGCPEPTLSNRFNSYRGCIRACSSLTDAYGKMLLANTDNETTTKKPAYRREYEPIEDTAHPEIPEEVEQDRKHMRLGEPVVLGNADVRGQLYDVIIPNIDYDSSYHVPDPEDWFHDVKGRKYRT